MANEFLNGPRRCSILKLRVQDWQKAVLKYYRSFVPAAWRGFTRWVWGMTILAIILLAQNHQRPIAGLRVYFFDIGQGDGFLIRTADGFDVLVDGGPTDAIVEKLEQVLPLSDRDIELMVLTHPHADHVVGLTAVLKRFKVKRVLATGVLHTTNEYLDWLTEIKKQGIPMEIAKAGQVWTLGRSASPAHAKTALGFPCEETGACAQSRSPPAGGAVPAGLPQHFCCDPSYQNGLADVRLEVLYPRDSFVGKKVKEGKIGEGGGLNDTSIVMKVTYGATAFLLMGDATSKVEKELLSCHPKKNVGSGLVPDRGGASSGGGQASPTLQSVPRDDEVCDLHADVLKVGHHGSKYSSSREFLEAVHPKYAVIQVGVNRYGHPSYAALRRLAQAGVKVFRNDQDGDVIMESDGKAVRVKVDGK